MSLKLISKLVSSEQRRDPTIGTNSIHSLISSLTQATGSLLKDDPKGQAILGQEIVPLKV